jgi:hypothetical protein
VSVNPELGRAVLELATDSTTFVQDIQNTRKILATLGATLRDQNKDFVGFRTHLEESGRSASTFGSLIQTAAGTFAGFVSAQAVLGGISNGFRVLASTAIGMNATLEKSTLQFTTLMGNSDKAKNHVKDLFEIAKKTPFETGPILQASMALQVAGGEALNTRGNIMLLGDAAAATGAPIDELSRWTGRLYAALQAGKPFGEATENLRRLAVMSPQTSNKLEELQKSGKSAAEIFKVFTDDLGRFGGAMAVQAGTFEGLTSTFKDTIGILSATALKPAFDTLKEGLDEINEWLDSDAAQEWAAEVSGAIKAGLESIKEAGSDTKAFVAELRDLWEDIPEPVLHTAASVGEVTAAVWLLNAAINTLSGSKLLQWLLAGGGLKRGGLIGAAVAGSGYLKSETESNTGSSLAGWLSAILPGVAFLGKSYGEASDRFDVGAFYKEWTKKGRAPDQNFWAAVDVMRRGQSTPAVSSQRPLFNPVYVPSPIDLSTGLGVVPGDSGVSESLERKLTPAQEKKLRQTQNEIVSSWVAWFNQMANTGAAAAGLFASANLATPSAFGRGTLAGPWQDFTGFGGSSSVMDADVQQALSFATWAGGNWGTLGTAQSKLDEWSGLVGTVTDHTTDWWKALTSVNDQLTRLGQVVGPGKFQAQVQDIANILGGVEMSRAGATGIGNAIVNATNTGELVTGLAGGSLQGIMGLVQATSSTSKLKNVLGGASAGAALGSVVPGIGTAIGVGVGVLVGLFRSTASAKAKEANASIAELQKSLLGAYGSLEKIAAAGGEAGKELVAAWGSQGQAGLTQFNAKLSDFNKAIEETKQLVSGLAALQPGELLSRALRAQIGSGTLTDEAKQAIGTFRSGQAATIADQIKAYLEGGGSLEGAQGRFLFSAASGAAGEMRAQGASFADIAAAIPGLGQLSGASGMSTTLVDTLNQVARPEIAAILKDSDQNRIIAGSLANLGLMNQETFDALTAGLKDSYSKLVAGGVQDDETKAMLQANMQQAWQMIQDYSLVADEATQQMLDQAEAQGVIGDAFRSKEDQLAGAMDRNTDALNANTRALGGAVAEASTGGLAVGVDPSFPEGDGTRRYHFGGLIQRAHRGMLIGPSALAANEVPLIGQIGEGVLSHLGMRTGERLLNDLNGGLVPAAGGDEHWQPVNVVVDGDVLVRSIVKVKKRNGW